MPLLRYYRIDFRARFLRALEKGFSRAELVTICIKHQYDVTSIYFIQLRPAASVLYCSLPNLPRRFQRKPHVNMTTLPLLPKLILANSKTKSKPSQQPGEKSNLILPSKDMNSER